MGTFAEHAQPQASENTFAAHKVITVPPSAFADDWRDKPQEPVDIGLRLVPDHDLQVARDDAFARTLRLYRENMNAQEAVDSFNDALLRHRIARTTCQPDDRRKPWFEAAEDTVRFALTPDGVKLLAFEIETFESERSPLFKPITDDEALDLAEILQDAEPFAGMSEAEERGTRRLLAVVLDRISTARARLAEQSDSDASILDDAEG